MLLQMHVCFSFSALSQETGCKECIRNKLFVGWNVKS